MDKTGSSGDGDVRRPLVSLSVSHALAFVIESFLLVGMPPVHFHRCQA